MEIIVEIYLTAGPHYGGPTSMFYGVSSEEEEENDDPMVMTEVAMEGARAGGGAASDRVHLVAGGAYKWC